MIFPSAKIIIKHPSDENRILLIKRTVHGKQVYEPAGGKVEVNFENKSSESLEECAIREAREELGLTVTIDGYLGSYYFFWTIDPNKCSSCALFVGSIVEKDTQFSGNTDLCELPFEPAWVSKEEIYSQSIPIDSSQMGLERLITAYFTK